MELNNSGNVSNLWRTQPMYSYQEVSRLSHVSVSTIRNWLHGYSTDYGDVKPLFSNHPDDEKVCSFLELIEIVVAAKFRKAEHVPFQTVRNAYENGKKLFNQDYPFAHEELKGYGGHIVHIIHVPGISLQAIDQPEQYTLPDLVQATLSQIEYERELASKWYPIGKDIPIVIDPLISAGLPIIQGRGITVEAIYKRFKADQEIAFIAEDFDIKPLVIEQVIRYREKVAV